MPKRKRRRVLVRFIASDGGVWTIYDATWSNGKHHPRPHADPTATERVFVNAKGVKRSYMFRDRDSRVFEEQALERQLRASMFLPTSKFDPNALSLSEAERQTPTFHTVDVKRPARGAPPGGSTPPSRAGRDTAGTGRDTRPR